MGRDLVRHIADFVLEERANGRLRGGARIPSRSELMRRFGCARATVDRAVERLAQDGVVESIQGRGTFLRAAAKARRHAKRALILIPDMKELRPDDPYTYPLFLGLLQGIGKVKYEVEDVDRLTAGRSPVQVAQDLKRRNVVLYWVRPRCQMVPFLAAAVKAGVPACCVHRDYQPAHVVDTDNVGGVEKAVGHLVEHGHRRLGFMGGEFGGEARHVEQRQLGFLLGLQTYGAATREEWLLNSQSRTEARDFLRHVFAAAEGPSGWIVLGATHAAALIGETRERRLRIPDDVSVISFDDPGPLLEDGRGFTHLEQQLVDVGKEAALLFDSFRRAPRSRIVLNVMPRLVPGDTVAGIASRRGVD
ncbi:MAG: substrate-binding domain-containing protein [Kiritimatiellae bacterium]|nr:substrate-binding domain-containing protein [Kiritimatiellia bacterium]